MRSASVSCLNNMRPAAGNSPDGDDTNCQCCHGNRQTMFHRKLDLPRPNCSESSHALSACVQPRAFPCPPSARRACGETGDNPAPRLWSSSQATSFAGRVNSLRHRCKPYWQFVGFNRSVRETGAGVPNTRIDVLVFYCILAGLSNGPASCAPGSFTDRCCGRLHLLRLYLRI